jgi:isopentenyldiphosphate isomerase
MEYLDIYDESGNHIGKEERTKVHQNALWHKTVHCWLFDRDGYVYFQIRHDEKTLYTYGIHYSNLFNFFPCFSGNEQYQSWGL